MIYFFITEITYNTENVFYPIDFITESKLSKDKKKKNLKIRPNYFLLIQVECMNQELMTVNNGWGGSHLVNIFCICCP